MMVQSLLGAGIASERADAVVKAFNAKVFWKKDEILNGAVAKRIMKLMDRTQFSISSWNMLKSDAEQHPADVTFNDDKLNLGIL